MEQSFAQSSKVIWIALVSNLALAAIKIIAGLLGHSDAMLAEGMNSSSDVLVTIVMLVSLRIARQPQDKEHPYGHGKAETIAAAVVGLTIVALAGIIIYGAIISIILGRELTPSLFTMYIAALAIITKEFLYRYTSKQATRLNSIILSAAAADHRSDQFTALAALIGIAFARAGKQILDPVAAIVIAFMIVYQGWKVLSASVYQLMDGQAEDRIINDIINAVKENEGVRDIKQVRGRIAGRGIYLDLTILMDPETPLDVSHRITEEVEEAVSKKVPLVLGVLTHVEPYYESSRK